MIFIYLNPECVFIYTVYKMHGVRFISDTGYGLDTRILSEESESINKLNEGQEERRRALISKITLKSVSLSLSESTGSTRKIT